MKAHRLMLALMIVMVSAMAVSVCAAEDSDAAAGTDLRVFIEAENGEFRETLVDSANTVKELITKASENLGMPIEYDRNGTISSVGGFIPDGTDRWNIHQWMPLGHHDWSSVGFDRKSDSQIISGASFCLHTSSQQLVNGTPVYGVPSFQPKAYGYFFVKFLEDYDSPEYEVQIAFDSEVRQNGFWLKGYGSNMGEVIEDAMNRNQFQYTFKKGTDANGNDLQCWFISFFGLGDEMEDTGYGGEKVYRYWSQFCYVDDRWGYNNYTMGYYDPGVYKYASCVRISGGHNINPGSVGLPDVEKEPVVPMEGFLDVSFKVDGEPYGEHKKVRYGQYLSRSDIPVYIPPEGMLFSGWGDVSRAIKEDTVFEGTTSVRPPDHIVRYFNEGGTVLLHTETVQHMGCARYDVHPEKPSDPARHYRFISWSSDLSCVQKDTDVRAVYESVPREYPVKFFDHKRELICTRYAAYGCALTDIPDPPVRQSTVDKVYGFRGWSDTPFEYVESDFSSVTELKTVYAAYTESTAVYKVRYVSEGVPILEQEVCYGEYIGEGPFMGLFENGHAVICRDPSMEDPVNSRYTVRGDCTLYAAEVPGKYSYVRYGDTVVKDTIELTFPAGVGRLGTTDFGTVVCDLSALDPDRGLHISGSVLDSVLDHVPEGVKLAFVFSRGTVLIDSGIPNGAAGEDGLNMSMENGPTSVPRINSSLRGVNWDALYSVSIKAGGMTIADPDSSVLSVQLVFPFAKVAGNPAMAWSIVPSTGALIPCSCESAGDSVIVTSFSLPYVAVGTQNPRTESVREDVICPYGDVSYETFGTDPSTYRCELISMTIDNRGEILFLPSSLEGYPLKTVRTDAFRGVTGADCMVIPGSVTSFHWGSLAGTELKSICFLGDAPEFLGTEPEGLMVHHASGTEGWESLGYGDLQIHRYCGDGFEFDYYCIGSEVTISHYVSGNRVDIPEMISIDGKDCTVRYIGSESFRDSEAEYVRIPDGIRGIHNRAFYSSDVKYVVWSEDCMLKHIGDEAFRACEFLRTVDLPRDLLFIGFEAFRNCSMIYSADIPDSVRVLGDGAYYVCERLGTVRMGGGVDVIPPYCFAYCVLLDDVRIPDSVMSIGESAFLKCGQLSFIDLNRVRSLGNDAFKLCSTLQSAVLGHDFDSMSAGCFAACPMLTQMEAYCVQPEGILLAFSDTGDATGIPESLSVMVHEGYADGWDVPCTIIHESDGPEDGGSGSLKYVIAGMMVLFAVLIVLSLRMKSAR